MIIAGLIVSLTGRAVKAEEQYHLIGQGTASCGKWTAVRHDEHALGHEQWILGFLSGVGWGGAEFGDNPLSGTDADGVLAWIDNYCRAHPLEWLAVAGGAFVHAHPH
jgi:hypothetical protein